MINEALLEMLYFDPLMRYFEARLGRKIVRVLKPSQRQEVWVGFDQGWVATTVETTQLLQQLRNAVQERRTSVRSLYCGYFLQFKLVDEIRRLNRAMPDGFTSPYFRSELSLKRSPTTGISQHETLKRLSGIANAQVHYACPMIFLDEEVLERPVDLQKLRFVDVRTSPPGWNTNEKHYIAFRAKDDPCPLWRSEPVEAKSIDIGGWFSALTVPGSLMSPNQAADFVQRARATFSREPADSRGLPAHRYPAQLTLIEFEENAE